MTGQAGNVNSQALVRTGLNSAEAEKPQGSGQVGVGADPSSLNSMGKPEEAKPKSLWESFYSAASSIFFFVISIPGRILRLFLGKANSDERAVTASQSLTPKNNIVQGSGLDVLTDEALKDLTRKQRTLLRKAFSGEVSCLAFSLMGPSKDSLTEVSFDFTMLPAPGVKRIEQFLIIPYQKPGITTRFAVFHRACHFETSFFSESSGAKFSIATGYSSKEAYTEILGVLKKPDAQRKTIQDFIYTAKAKLGELQKPPSNKPALQIQEVE